MPRWYFGPGGLAVAAAHGLFPLLKLTREPFGAERDPQAATILRGTRQ